MSRTVFDDFPHSQHRPVLIEYGVRIPLIESVRKPRWNFRKADWCNFQNELDRLLEESPFASTPEEYDKFTNLMKEASLKHVPRGVRDKYIPTWDAGCSRLYSQFKSTNNNETGDLLNQRLNENRKKRWQEKTEDIDFTHSSREAWSLLKKLGNDSVPNPKGQKLSPNEIATRLLVLSEIKSVLNRRRSESRE